MTLCIGLISGEYPPLTGGVGAFTQILARTLAEHGHIVHVLTDQRAEERDPAITLTAAIPSGGWSLTALRRAQQWAAKLDIVNLQYQTAAYAMSPFIHWLPDALRPRPVVTTFHDRRFPYLFPKAGPLRPWIVDRLARASAGVIATNHEDHAALSRHPRAALIPIGSNILAAPPPTAERPHWRSRAGATADDFLIAYFGFLNASKGVDTLLAALCQARQAGERWRLVIVGERVGASDPTNAAYAAQIDAQIAALGLTDAVTWTGYADDAAVSAYLAAADAIALPFHDGASFRRGTLMAALQAGRPIVTTQPTVTIPDFVPDHNLLLVPPADPAALRSALSRIAADAKLAARLSKGARELAQHFNWNSIAQQTVSHLLRVFAAYH